MASCVVMVQFGYVSATQRRAMSRTMKMLRRMRTGTASKARRERIGRSDA